MRRTFLEKLISYTLIATLSVQPALLQAQSITVVGPDNGPRPRVDQSHNGTTVLNINTPNGAGVSHDVYTNFNANDLIINNSATITNTQIGGYIEGNPNLTPGGEASLWIGEVVGGSQTQLNGILEVAGNSLDVVLANEYGITCNGCGFVNTGRTTLTTGSPVFDTNGSLTGFDVRRGTVTVTGAGLNPDSRVSLQDTSRVDVIARAAHIYGAMRAEALNTIAGANLVDYDWSYDPVTGQVTGVTEQSGLGAVPSLAVDVAALGGMYANAITMIATEDGVGVRFDGELASASDIAIRSDGQLTLGSSTSKIKASEQVRVRSDGPILLEGSIESENGNLIDIRSLNGTLTFTGQASGGAITLESAGMAAVSAAIVAQNALSITSTQDGVALLATAEITADSLDLDAAGTARVEGEVSTDAVLDIEAGAGVEVGTASTLLGGDIRLAGQTVSNAGTIASARDIVIEAAGTFTNAAAVVAGDDLEVFADQVINNGGVLWANDDITLAGNAALDPATLVQNTNGRIESLQGDLVVRAATVSNIGTAPTIGQSTITRWVDQANAGAIDPVDQISKLIDPAYLDTNGNILPAYAGEYAALWADLVEGGGVLSAQAQSILKTTVVDATGAAIHGDFIVIWQNMLGKANAHGTLSPAAQVMSMVDPAIFDAAGNVLPAYAEAYAELWQTLGAGGTSVSASVKAILDPSVLISVTTTDPVTGLPVTTVTNDLEASNPNLWSAMTAPTGAPYDIVNILYQDRFNNDGTLAEMIAGGNVDIQADTVNNIFGIVSAGQDVAIVANTVTNQALGASQVLLEVHKRPDCFTCHEGNVDYYDTFGGRIEAVNNVNITGNLNNVTLKSSNLTTQDVINELNTFIQNQQNLGAADLVGVPLISNRNLDLSDVRSDDFTAPEEGNGIDIRDATATNTGAQTATSTAGTVSPSLTPTASVNQLVAQGINALAETDPEFTDYANFITSNYMMDVDRLQYRDELVNNTTDTGFGRPDSDSADANPGPMAWLDQPVRVPNPDGPGFNTVYPSSPELGVNESGALISGQNVSVAGSTIVNAGAILASVDASLTAKDIFGSEGSIVAETGTAALTALNRILLDDTEISGKDVDIIAGQDFVGRAVAISSETDTSIFATAGVTLSALSNEYEITRTKAETYSKKQGRDDLVVTRTVTRLESTMTATEQRTSSLDVGGNLSIVTSGDLTMAGLKGDVGGDTNLSAGRDINLLAVQSEVKYSQGDKKNGTDLHIVDSHLTDLTTGGDFTATAGRDAVIEGAQIMAAGDARLAAGDDVVLAAARDIYSYEKRKSKSGFLSKKSSSHSKFELTHQEARIIAGGEVDVIAEQGDLTTAGTSFMSRTGDINLTSVEGDIYAGTYTDVFREEKKKSRSFLGGLLGSSSQKNTVDQYNSGTAALANADLSLVSGDDTTLVGANLSAGQNLNINTGGDFSVQAAIDSERSQFFSSNMGLVTMTTIQESSFVETAVFTKLLAGQGINLDIAGIAALSIYHQAGIDAPNLEDLYPEELLAFEGLQLINQELANEYFYDKQTTLSPAFKALVAIVVAAYMPGLIAGIGQTAIAAGAASTTSSIAGITTATTTATGAVQLTAFGKGLAAAASSATVSTLDAIVSGDFDLGEILEGAVFSGVTAGLTAGVDLDTIGIDLGEAGNLNLLGFGSESGLTLSNLLEGALDGALSSGLSSTVYGTDFIYGLTSSVTSTVVNLALADAQFEIGELGDGIDNWEGSAGHAVLHGLAGCAAAAAQGADCTAGAVGGVAGSLMSGYLERHPPETNENFSAQEQEFARIEYEGKITELVSAVAGYLVSGGKAQNVSFAATIGQSAVLNNRNLHIKEAELIEKYADEFAKELCKTRHICLSTAEAKERLTAETLRGVSDDFAFLPKDDIARAFLNSLSAAGEELDGNTLFGELDRGSAEYQNSYMNIGDVQSYRDLYSLVTVGSFRDGEERTAVDLAYIRAAAELPSYATKEEVLAAADGLAAEEARLRARAAELIASDDVDQMMHGFALEKDADILSGYRMHMVALQKGKFSLDELTGNSGDPKYDSISSSYLDIMVSVATALDIAAGGGALAGNGSTNSIPNPPSLTISNSQWGTKLRKHTRDFGLDVSNPAHRQQLRDRIENIGSNPDRVVTGTFSGGGPNGRRDVLFYVKGSDVVVASPAGEFVTVLQNGVTNPNVIRALGQ